MWSMTLRISKMLIKLCSVVYVEWCTGGEGKQQDHPISFHIEKYILKKKMNYILKYLYLLPT